jgi:hypothetical protein
MSSISAFRPQGPPQTITGATSAPTALQCLDNTGLASGSSINYLVTNETAALALLIMGPTAAACATAASTGLPTAGTQTAITVYPAGVWLIPIMGPSQVTITGPAGAFFTALTRSGTATIDIVPGEGV